MFDAVFDVNSFKRSVKEWMRQNPEGGEEDLVDFCEEQIPPSQYAVNKWLVEHTLSWYRHVLAQRRMAKAGMDDEQDGALS